MHGRIDDVDLTTIDAVSGGDPRHLVHGGRGGHTGGHQNGADANEGSKFAPSRHNNACNETADRSGQRGNGKSSSSGGGRIEKHDLEK